MLAKLHALAIGLTLSLISPAALHAEALTVLTARGGVSVVAPPKSVAVFDVAAVDTLDALGVPIAGTMGNLFVDYLDEVAKGAEDLGSFFEPDVEAVHALQPELIIVGGRSSNQVRSLGRVAPTIDMTIGIDLMTEAVARLRSYGQLFGKETEAASLEAQLKSRVAEARAAAQGKGDALIIMANGPKISAYGVGGRFGWVHEAVGLQEAAPKIGASIHGEAVSFEFIRKTNPDWLIVVDRLAAIGRPGAQAKATLDNALVQQTKAWQSDQVIYLNAADIYIAHGGVQSMLRTLEELIAALNAS